MNDLADQLQHQASQAYRTARALARGNRPEADAAFQEAYRLARAADAAYDRRRQPPSQGGSPMKEYRNVTQDPDGTIHGEYRWTGTDEPWRLFSARLDLEFIDQAIIVGGKVAVAAIWQRQDGYGEPGYTPPQGFDWSGIRDSSPDAVAQMVAVASEFVSRSEFLSALGLKEASWT